MTIIYHKPKTAKHGRQASLDQLSTDVVVVGAGLSGLQCAKTLQDAGVSCIVLEANNRVGGKTLSLQPSKGSHGKVDVGAAWINDTNQSHMYALARRYGFDLKIQRSTGLSIAQKSDGTVSKFKIGEDNRTDEEREVLLSFLGELTELIDGCNLQNPVAGVRAQELDGITLKEFGKRYPPVVQGVLTELAQAFLGVESEEMSALFFLDYVKSGTGLQNMSMSCQRISCSGAMAFKR